MRRMIDPKAIAYSPKIHMPMLDTAEVIAKRYEASRGAQDEYVLQLQQRTTAVPMDL